MRNQQWILVTESEMDQNRQLAKLISFIFSDQYLYVHAELRKMIDSDRKGYVAVQYVAMIDIIQHFFDSLQLGELSLRVYLIIKNIQQGCRELLVHNNRIRRICPFDAKKLRRVKPIYLEGIKEGTTISDVREHLGSTAFSTIKDIRQSDIDYVMVYAPEYRLISNESSCHTLPFKIVNYETFCRERDYQSRFWENQQRSFYAELINQKKRPDLWTPDIENNREEPDKENASMTQERYDHVKAQFDCLVKIPNPSINCFLQRMVNKSLQIQ